MSIWNNYLKLKFHIHFTSKQSKSKNSIKSSVQSAKNKKILCSMCKLLDWENFSVFSFEMAWKEFM